MSLRDSVHATVLSFNGFFNVADIISNLKDQELITDNDVSKVLPIIDEHVNSGLIRYDHIQEAYYV